MKRTLIIAEAGVNHNGSMEIAKQLIDVAADAGVDYIKFQTFKADMLVSKDAAMADYQKENLQDYSNSQYEMLKKLELSPEQHLLLISYCNQKSIKFFSTAFDMESLYFLSTLHLGLWKIPSGEITNYPYLKFIAQQKAPVILSTGMSQCEEIADALSVLIANGLPKDKITVLHCNTEYPTPMADVNLLAMCSIANKFQVKVGYSDHTCGIEVPIAATALGAVIIEKHFTIDRGMVGPDHKASLEPDELKSMVSAIRNVDIALGSSEKRVTASELKNKSVARKSIVALCTIMKGESFTEQNITVKRPGNGLSPMCWSDVIGKVATKQYESDELIIL